MARVRLDRRPYPDAVKLEIARTRRSDPTPVERHAWSLVCRSGLLGLKFRRQHILRGFIVDFYCPRLRLVLELDGAEHLLPTQAGYDAERTALLEACGYRVLRVRNCDLSRQHLEDLIRPLMDDSWFPLSR
jgi:very-short-patch-repair endonuclease